MFMQVARTVYPKYPITDFSCWKRYIFEALELQREIYVPMAELIDEFYRVQQPKFMKDESIKFLKKKGYHSKRLYFTLQHEASQRENSKGERVPWNEIKDAPKSKLIDYVNHFNKYRQGMKDYEFTFVDKTTGIIKHEEDGQHYNLYAAKDAGREIIKREKLTNVVMHCKQVNKQPKSWA